jgi:hypothetical protein
LSPARKTTIISASAVLVFLVAFGHYTHGGYLGVVETGGGFRLLDHGFHLRPPWAKVTMYPLRCREVRLEILSEVPGATIHFDGVLLVSVRADSVPSLHKAYQGAYMERVVSPMLSEFLRDHSEGYGLWDDTSPQKVTSVVMDFLGPEAAEYGVNITQIWLRSFDVERAPGALQPD